MGYLCCTKNQECLISSEFINILSNALGEIKKKLIRKSINQLNRNPKITYQIVITLHTT